MKPRRSVWPAGAAAATLLEGLGSTVCGFAGAGLAGAAGFAGAASAALAATSLAFLAPVCRRASARSRGSVIFSSGGSVRGAPAALAAGAAAGCAAAGLAPAAAGAARRAGSPGRGQLLLERHGPAQGLGRRWNGRRLGGGGRLGGLGDRRGLGRRGGCWGRSRRCGRSGGAAPPARAAASFSLSVSGLPRVDGVGTLGGGAEGAAGGGAATAAGSTAEASTSTISSTGAGLGAAAASGSACGFAAPPFRAASRISCTLGRFAIAQSRLRLLVRLVPAGLPRRGTRSSPSPKSKRNATPRRPRRTLYVLAVA